MPPGQVAQPGTGAQPWKLPARYIQSDSPDYLQALVPAPSRQHRLSFLPASSLHLSPLPPAHTGPLARGNSLTLSYGPGSGLLQTGTLAVVPTGHRGRPVCCPCIRPISALLHMVTVPSVSCGDAAFSGSTGWMLPLPAALPPERPLPRTRPSLPEGKRPVPHSYPQAPPVPSTGKSSTLSDTHTPRCYVVTSIFTKPLLCARQHSKHENTAEQKARGKAKRVMKVQGMPALAAWLRCCGPGRRQLCWGPPAGGLQL